MSTNMAVSGYQHVNEQPTIQLLKCQRICTKIDQHENKWSHNIHPICEDTEWWWRNNQFPYDTTNSQYASHRRIFSAKIIYTQYRNLKSHIDVLYCKLHYGFGGNRLPTLSKQVSFSEFIKKVTECTWFITLADSRKRSVTWLTC